ncbi:MAG: hypothetical protein V7607_5609 [Solirubrobacteraceae bacterium]
MAPGADALGGGRRRVGVHVCRHPMSGGQELEAVWRFEAVDQLDDAVAVLARLGVVRKERFRLVDRARQRMHITWPGSVSEAGDISRSRRRRAASVASRQRSTDH